MNLYFQNRQLITISCNYGIYTYGATSQQHVNNPLQVRLVSSQTLVWTDLQSNLSNKHCGYIFNLDSSSPYLHSDINHDTFYLY
jgi:hypothetical protein